MVIVFSSANVGGANKGNRWLCQVESKSKMMKKSNMKIPQNCSIMFFSYLSLKFFNAHVLRRQWH